MLRPESLMDFGPWDQYTGGEMPLWAEVPGISLTPQDSPVCPESVDRLHIQCGIPAAGEERAEISGGTPSW